MIDNMNRKDRERMRAIGAHGFGRRRMEPGVICENGRNKRVCLCDPARGIFNHRRVVKPDKEGKQ